MKRFLVLAVLLMCIVPLASATVHTYSVTKANENEGVVTQTIVGKTNSANITSIQSLVIEGCSGWAGENPSYNKAGSFELKNQTNVTLGMGSYSSQFEDRTNAFCPAKTIVHTYTFSNYSNAYPGIVDNWYIWYNNGIGYWGDGALTGTTTGKTTFVPTVLPARQISGGYTFTYIATDEPAPVADFTGAPTSGAAPLYVLFNDTSTNDYSGCSYNWSITPASGISAGATGTLENHAASFSVPGNYTVSHGVSCAAGSNISTKTNYITVYNTTTDYITTHFVVLDEPRWFQLAGSTINMKDVENNSWVNVSPSATGYEGITTLSNHTINAYASMTGYGDEELLAKPAWSGGDYQLLMFPDGYANVSAGNVTAYVTVFGSDVFRLSGATVNMAYADPEQGQINDYRTTDESGMVSFVVPNNTVIYFYASKPGYTDGGTSVNSGTGSGGDASVYTDVTLQRSTVTTVPTATTLPGGGTPTATAATVDPYPCVGDGSYQDTLNCQRKQGEMGADAIKYANMLIPLFVLATIVGTLKIMGK